MGYSDLPPHPTPQAPEVGTPPALSRDGSLLLLFVLTAALLMTSSQSEAPGYIAVCTDVLTTSMPSTTAPKTTCFPSRCAVFFVHRKNCDVPVFGLYDVTTSTAERASAEAESRTILHREVTDEALAPFALSVLNPRYVHESLVSHRPTVCH